MKAILDGLGRQDLSEVFFRKWLRFNQQSYQHVTHITSAIIRKPVEPHLNHLEDSIIIQ